MADSSKKRSRKEKLTLRDCTDVEKEDLDLVQFDDFEEECNVPKKTMNYNNTKKVPKTTKLTLNNKTVQFSVQVEVEEYDEDIAELQRLLNKENALEANILTKVKVANEVDDHNYYQKLFISNENDNLLTYENYVPNKNKPNLFTPNTVTHADKVLKILLERLFRFTNSEPDRIIEIGIRNYWGKIVKDLPEDYKDCMLQETLSKWKDWANSKKKITPNSYKCYDCKTAWWHYSMFRQHFFDHESDMITRIEVVKQDCNIITYSGELPKFQEFEIKDPCPRCGKDFNIHRIDKKDVIDRISCEYCNFCFISCEQVAFHEGRCQKFMAALYKTANKSGPILGENEYICPVCSVICLTEERYNHHMVTVHSVWSDTPIVSVVKVCPLCENKFVVSTVHCCASLVEVCKCKHCHKPFPRHGLSQLHKLVNDYQVSCMICNNMLASPCLELLHMVSHSNMYATATRCVYCAKMFVDVEAVKDHLKKNHRLVKKVLHVFEMIIVPKYLKNDAISRRKCNIEINKNTAELERRFLTEQNFNIDNDFYLDTSDDYRANDNEITEANSLDLYPNYFEKDTALDDSNGLDNIEIVRVKHVNEIKEEVKEELDDNISIKEESFDFISNVKRELDDEEITTIIEIKEEVENEETERWKQREENVIVNQEQFDKFYQNIIKEYDVDGDVIYYDDEEQGCKKRFGTSSTIYRCSKCPYQGYKEEFDAHRQSNCDFLDLEEVNKIVCSRCNLGYKCFIEYARHFTKHGLKIRVCPECSVQTMNIVKLQAHIQKHMQQCFKKRCRIDENGQKVYECSKCEQEVYYYKLRMHWESHLDLKPDRREIDMYHMPKNLLHCRRDSFILKKWVLDEAIEVLTIKEVAFSRTWKKECIICQRSFSRANECKRHIIEHLLRDAYVKKGSKEEITCQLCQEKFLKIFRYKEHMRLHAGLPIYKCHLCEKSFSDSSNFVKHRKVHNLGVLTCDLCNRKFTMKKTLERHMLTHRTSSNRLVKCFKCPKTFYFPQDYAKHNRERHNPKKMHICYLCKQEYNRKKDLWEHLWQDHKIRTTEFDCPFCDTLFRKRSELKKHLSSNHPSLFNKHC